MNITDEMIEAGAKAVWEFWHADQIPLGADWDVVRQSTYVSNEYEVEGARAQSRACLTAALGEQEAPLEGDEPLATDAMIVERIADLEAQVHRLRTFAEEMAWYAPEQDWEDAARRLLRFGDVRSIPEIYEAAKGGEG